MTQTGIGSIDQAPQVVAEWLREIREPLGWEENGRAYLLLRTTLHAVRDWLPMGEATDLAAQLPLLVRGFYFDGWKPSKTPAKPHNKQEFVARVTDKFVKEPLEDPEKAIAAVLAVLKRHVTDGEIEDVVQAMPKPLRELWH